MDEVWTLIVARLGWRELRNLRAVNRDLRRLSQSRHLRLVPWEGTRRWFEQAVVEEDYSGAQEIWTQRRSAVLEAWPSIVHRMLKKDRLPQLQFLWHLPNREALLPYQWISFFYYSLHLKLAASHFAGHWVRSSKPEAPLVIYEWLLKTSGQTLSDFLLEAGDRRDQADVDMITWLQDYLESRRIQQH